MICPHAKGFIPQELECGVRRSLDVTLPWWRRLWRALRGYYWCEEGGELPCPTYETAEKGHRR